MASRVVKGRADARAVAPDEFVPKDAPAGDDEAQRVRPPSTAPKDSGVYVVASDAAVEVPDDLGALILVAQRAAADVGTAQAEYAYALGTVAVTAIRRGVRGSSAMNACAAALGLARRTLASFAPIVSRLSLKELRELFERARANGHPLTTSHILLVAPLSKAARDRLLERVITEGLNIQRLREALSYEP